MRLQRWGHPTRRAAQKAPGNDGRAPRTPHLPRLLFKSVLFPDGNEPGDGALPIKKRLHSHANPLVQCLKSARRGRQVSALASFLPLGGHEQSSLRVRGSLETPPGRQSSVGHRVGGHERTDDVAEPGGGGAHLRADLARLPCFVCSRTGPRTESALRAPGRCAG